MEDGHRSLYDIIETRKDELDTPFSADYIEKVEYIDKEGLYTSFSADYIEKEGYIDKEG